VRDEYRNTGCSRECGRKERKQGMEGEGNEREEGLIKKVG
jgi:hypothetical protein